MAKSVEQIVTELADREAIRDLPQSYCDCVWRHDSKGIAELFAPDGSFTIIGPERETCVAGHAEIVKFYSDALAKLTPRPYIHNHVIDLQGNGRATGRCYVELRNLKSNMDWVGSGYYEDEYAKAGDEWKFKSRTFRTVYMSVNPG